MPTLSDDNAGILNSNNKTIGQNIQPPAFDIIIVYIASFFVYLYIYIAIYQYIIQFNNYIF